VRNAIPTRLRAWAATSVLVAGLALAPAPAALASGKPAAAIPDVTTLFGRAVKIVRGTRRPTFARAVVLEADGITRGGECTTMGCFGGSGVTSAAGVIAWRFVFDNQPSNLRIRSATIFYVPQPKHFGKVTGYRAPFLNDVDIPRAPRMTLPKAIALLRRAGHRGRFFNVALRNPLGPTSSHVLYIFGLAHQFVSVDTVTEQVATLR
jgi:hypothetical protein